VDGVAADVTDVIVRVERQDGSGRGEHLLRGRTEFTVKPATGVSELRYIVRPFSRARTVARVRNARNALDNGRTGGRGDRQHPSRFPI